MLNLRTSNLLIQFMNTLHGNQWKRHLTIAHAKHVLEDSNTMSHKAYSKHATC
jgi:hypothetical protein